MKIPKLALTSRLAPQISSNATSRLASYTRLSNYLPSQTAALEEAVYVALGADGKAQSENKTSALSLIVLQNSFSSCRAIMWSPHMIVCSPHQRFGKCGFAGAGQACRSSSMSGD